MNYNSVTAFALSQEKAEMDIPDENSPDSILSLELLSRVHTEWRFEAVAESLDGLVNPFSWAENFSRETNQVYVESQSLESSERTYAILCRRQGTFLGEVSVSPKGPLEDRCFLSYWIRRSERRKGYGLAACRALIELEDRALGLYISNSNIASRRLATKLGARAVGSIYMEEEPRDMVTVYHLPRRDEARREL